MKKLLIILLVTLLCGCDANNPYKCQQSVEKMFPNAKIYRIRHGYDFIVEDSVHLYHVETMSMSSPEVTDVVKLR